MTWAYLAGLFTTPGVVGLCTLYLMTCTGPGVSMGHVHKRDRRYVYHHWAAYVPERLNRWWFKHVTAPHCRKVH